MRTIISYENYREDGDKRMTELFKDMNGKNIKVGDTIAYASSRNGIVKATVGKMSYKVEIKNKTYGGYGDKPRTTKKTVIITSYITLKKEGRYFIATLYNYNRAMILEGDVNG